MNLALSRRLANVRARVADRVLDFKPFLRTLAIGEERLRFFYATAQAVDWYDPLDPHLVAELEWLQRRLAARAAAGGGPETILDAGAYHGLYAMVLARAAAPGSRVVAVDPVASNGAIMAANFALNGLDIEIVRAAVTAVDAPVGFTRESCGRVTDGGAETVDGRRLTSLLPDATVAKVDIEGAEIDVLPEQLDRMTAVHTWIVEIHPGFGFDPETIVSLFRARGFALHVLDRARASVVPWPDGAVWRERTSLIALHPST